MAIITVGAGLQYATIAAGIAAAQNGDVVKVQAGTYTNDFASISKNITLQGVGGMVHMVATQSPSNGKAILDVGGAGLNVSISNFEFSGAAVPDGNGAGIRYEGGNLSLSNDYFHDNQDGLLSNADPNGTITIDHSEFANNGGGDGHIHNIYVGDIAQLTITNSYFHGAQIGHEIKSRAENTTITGNRIVDGASGTGSYDIDLPNGGNATISNNLIEKGPNAGNPVMIAYGEEGALHSGTTVAISGNTMLNDRGSAVAVWNAAGTTAMFTGNSTYGLSASQIAIGPVAVSGTTQLSSEPAIDTTSPWASNITAPAPSVAWKDTTAGTSGTAALQSYSGAGGLQWQYTNLTKHNLSISANVPGAFLTTGAGNDVLQAAQSGSGANVLSAGRGSNVMIGGTASTDSFRADLRGGTPSWNTVANFHAGDSLTLLGLAAGAFTSKWSASETDPTGHSGVTLDISMGGVASHVTFAGLGLADCAQFSSKTTVNAAGVSALKITF